MLLFRFQPDFSYQPSESELAAEALQWGNFIGNLAIQERLVSTSQLGFGGKMIDAAGQVADGIHIADKQTLGGNLVIVAGHIDEAAEIAKSCPILAMGGNVEVREIMPMN